MINIIRFMKQFFNLAAIETEKTSTGTAYCRIANPLNPSQKSTKPLGFVVSHDKSFYELVLIARTLQFLNSKIGFLPEIRIFSANNSAQFITKSCLNHIRKNPHELGALVSVAPWLASLLYNKLTAEGVHMPLLFGNIHEPDKLGIKPHSWSGGVSTQVQSYTKQLETIKILKPHLKRALIPHDTLLHTYYTSSSNIEYGNIAAFKDECKKQNIKPILMGITPDDNIARNIRQYNPEETMFMITREPSVLYQTEEIITACNHQGIAAFSDLPLPTLHGAAFGSGDSGIGATKQLAAIIEKVIVEHVLPGQLIQPHIVESNRLLYNGENLAAQGVKIDTKTVRLLEAQDIMVVANNQEYIL